MRQRQWWNTSHPRRQCLARQRQLSSTSHPRRQCLNRKRQLWSTSHPRRQRFKLQRQLWSTSHLGRQCFNRQERLIVVVFRALSQDRVQQLVVTVEVFNVLLVEVFEVLSPGRVHSSTARRGAVGAAPSGGWASTPAPDGPTYF